MKGQKLCWTKQRVLNSCGYLYEYNDLQSFILHVYLSLLCSAAFLLPSLDGEPALLVLWKYFCACDDLQK